MAINLNMKFISLLLAAIVVVTNQVVIGDPVEQLRSLCANKEIDLALASQLNGLVGALGSVSSCSPRIQTALLELDQLMNQDNDNVCLPSKIEQTRAYYKKFVDKKSINSQHEIKLPTSLKKLFLGYGFSVSKMCKSNMISSLVAASNELLSARDFEQVAKFISDASPLARLMRRPKDVDDFVLPKDIIDLLVEAARKKGEKVPASEQKVSVALQPNAAIVAKRIQTVCKRRFRPIYEQLILPVVSLSRIGLNYKGEELESHLREMQTNEEVHKWFRIVYLCESMASIQVFEDHEPGSDQKMFRILTNDQAQELMRTSLPTAKSLINDTNIGDSIVYKLGKAHKLADLVLNRQDKTIKKLIDKFEVNKSELARMRSKIMKQMFSFLKEFFRSRKVSIVAKLLEKGGLSNLNEQLSNLADQYANQIGKEQDDHSLAHINSRVKREIDWPAFWATMTFVGVIAIIVIIIAVVVVVLALHFG